MRGTFAGDRRGRVPFALVGVVLLLTSTAYAAALHARDPPSVRSDTSRALTEAMAAARTDVSVAATGAARAAARRPLVVPANTTYGRVVNRSSPFRDALRLRVYAAVRDALAASESRVGHTTARVSLPPVTDASSLRAAKRRVELASVDPERVRVHVEGLVARARRGGRVTARRRYTATVTVGTPVLSLHRNVTAFARRLNATLSEGGLGAALTVRLAALAWARGYAQYGGAPIANVLANRHVALATNDALLALQRTSFGHADPAGERALWRAAARTGVTDAVRGVETAVENHTGSSLSTPAAGTVDRALASRWRGSSPRNRSLRVGVNRSADAAYLDVAGDGNHSLRAVLDRVYSLRARFRVRTRRLTDGTRGRRHVDGDWGLVDVSRSRSTSVRPAGYAGEGAPPGHRRLDAFVRRVERTTRVTRTWQNGTRTRQTVAVHRTVTRVSVAVVGRLAPTRYAPRRPFDRPGADGPFGGVAPDAARRAVRRLVGRHGGADAVARQAASGHLDTAPVAVHIDRPDGLRARTLTRLQSLHRRLRNVSVDVDRRGVVSVNPPDRLDDALADRRASIVDPPAAYTGLSTVARVASRGAYLAALRTRLRRRATRERSLRDRLRETLRAHGALPAAALGSAAANGTTRSTVDGSPAYLSLHAVETADGTSRYPLAARNVNVFTVPYGAAADAVTSAVLDRPTDETSLRVAGRTLRSASQTLSHASNATLASRRADLRDAVADRLAAVRRRATATLTAVAPGLSARQRRRAVEQGFERWSTPAGRALAATNGSLARAIADETPVAPGAATESVRRLRLRLALDAALRGGQVSQAPVASTGASTRRVARRLFRSRVEKGLRRGAGALAERWVGDALTAVPAGLPMTPMPGYWYATLNAWHVGVRGRYERFAVRAPATGPAPSENVTYVRRDAPVAFDVDGDGNDERIGRVAPVRFAVETAVVVVVPPGGPGVGDTSGGRDERSAGWSPTAE